MSTIAADLAEFVDRAAAITGSYGRTRNKPERVDAASNALLAAELVNQELDAFIRFVYRRNDKGRLLHIMPDGQIPSGVWAPWGGSGKSQLTRSQRDTLRTWMLDQGRKLPKPPFYYIRKSYRWFVDLRRYEDEADALRWLANHQITVQDWLNMQTSVQ